MLIHTCHAFGCKRALKRKFLMCPEHWEMVPRPLQQEVRRCYQAGQEAGLKTVTKEYVQAARSAIEYVKAKEMEDALEPGTDGPPGDVQQLSLLGEPAKTPGGG